MATCQFTGDGMSAAATYEFPPLQELLIGRDPGSAPEAQASAGSSQGILKVAEKHSTVSRLHVRLTYDEKTARFLLTGLSANGTLVDGQKIADHAPVPLKDGASIRLSPNGPVYRFQAAPSAQAARPGAGSTEQLMQGFFRRMAKDGSGTPGKRTMEMGRELLRRVADRSTGKKFKVLIGVIAVLALAGGASYFYQRKNLQAQSRQLTQQGAQLAQQSAQLSEAESRLAQSREILSSLQGQVSSVQTQVRSVQADSGKIRELEGRLRAYENAPKPSQGDLSEVYKKAARSVYFISVRPRDTGRESWSASMGTAWPAAPNVLVTNAHVALGIMKSAREMRGYGEQPVGYARLSGEGTECMIDAENPKIFQRYLNNHHGEEAEGEAYFYDDVAAYKTNCSMAPLTLVSQAEYEGLQSGMGLVLVGFPEIVMHFTRKKYTATFSAGYLMQFDDEALVHSALESGGSSGSPIVDMKGRVIGINAGVFSEERKIGNFGIGPSILRVQALLRGM